MNSKCQSRMLSITMIIHTYLILFYPWHLLLNTRRDYSLFNDITLNLFILPKCAFTCPYRRILEIIKDLWHGDAIWRWRPWSTSVQIVHCRLFGTKPSISFNQRWLTFNMIGHIWPSVSEIWVEIIAKIITTNRFSQENALQISSA